MASTFDDASWSQRAVAELPPMDIDSHPRWRRIRIGASVAATTLAVALLWFALVAPSEISRLSPGAFVRIPVEGLLVVALALALPRRASRILALIGGVVLGLLTVVKVLDMGFLTALDRPFDPVSDWSYLPPAVDLLINSIGRFETILVLACAAALLLAVVVLLPLALGRVTRIARRHRRRSNVVLAALTIGWVIAAGSTVQFVPGIPVASSSAAGLAVDQLRQIRAGVKDQHTFSQAISYDPLSITPAAQLLNGLRGRDVLVLFVESYGRVAVQNSTIAPGVDAILDSATGRLQEAGFAARSAFLTSPTFGGISWLAHSTLQSGLWINSQQRYDQLISSGRFTLSDAFHRAGWRTVSDVPSNGDAWPFGKSFYHDDQTYGDHDVGYQGPSFSYASMPDQYVMSAFERLELANPQHSPVMAEIDLVSSHTPWAPLPRLIPWGSVGDGSAFAGMPAEGRSPTDVWRDPAQVRAAYGQSIEYTLNTLVSFVQTYPDPNLVLVVLGDHQPATVVTGQGASHDVPISIVAHDPTVLDRIAGWGWQPGMRPGPDAPVWRMDSFRDRFLTAYAR